MVHSCLVSVTNGVVMVLEAFNISTAKQWRRKMVLSRGAGCQSAKPRGVWGHALPGKFEIFYNV